jgi:hypothetical protein
MMSSQLKQWRRPATDVPDIARSLLSLGIARSLLHFSMVWKTSLSSHHVGGISGVRSGWSEKSGMDFIRLR